jgi:dTMP kinase
VGEADFVRQPDLTVWFDLPADIAAQRLAGARAPDKFEAQPVEFFRRVSQGYRDRMTAFPNRFTRIEAGNTRDVVWLDVLNAMQARGWLA